MKYKIRTVSNDSIEVELNDTNTVGDLIDESCKMLGKSTEGVFLIYATKKFTDRTQKLSELNYVEGKFIILYVSAIVSSTKSTQVEQKPEQTSEKSEEADQKEIDADKAKEEHDKKEKEANFQSILSNLIAMGFPADACERALRISDGNQNLALNLILNRRSYPQINHERRDEEQRIRRERRRNAKKIRLSPPTYHTQENKVTHLPGFKIAETRKHPPSVINVYSEFIRNSEHTMERLNKIIQEQSLELMDAIQQNPTPMVTMLGISVQMSPISGIQTMPFTEVIPDPLVRALDLTQEEVPVIMRLIQTGAPLPVVVNAYRETHNNESLTMSFLRNHFS